MTGFDEFSYPATGFADEAGEDPLAALERISQSQEALGRQMGELLAGLNSIAANLNPLLAKQYQATEARIRMLEVRIRNRQERPLINRMAELLAAVRRLSSGADVAAHVEEALLDALNSFGYAETGEDGEPFDPGRHEPVSGSVGRAGVVTRVLQRGLACQGDVIKKALVEVRPAPVPGDAPGEVAANREPGLEAQDAAPGGGRGAGRAPGAGSEQGGIPA